MQENHFGGIACHEVREQIDAYVAGALPQDVKSRIDAHLRQCALCQKMMRDMPAMQAAVWPPSTLPECECPECRSQRQLATVRPLGGSQNALLASALGPEGIAPR